MDALDIRIVRELGLRPYGAAPRDPESLKPAEVARRLRVEPKTVKARLDGMREDGFLHHFEAFPNFRHLGRAGSAHLFRIPDEDRRADALRRIEPIEGLMEVHSFVGGATCVDLAHRSPADHASKLRLLADFTGDAAPVLFYERHMPAVGSALSPLDWRILAALRHRADRPLADVAGEVGVSLKTVRRRFDRMAGEGSLFVVPVLDPSRAAGLVLFELLFYTAPDAGPGTLRAILAALDEHYVYHYVPSSQSLGNFDVLLFARSMATIEELRQKGRAIPGVVRVDSLVFRGWNDYSGWIDDEIAARAKA